MLGLCWRRGDGGTHKHGLLCFAGGGSRGFSGNVAGCADEGLSCPGEMNLGVKAASQWAALPCGHGAHGPISPDIVGPAALRCAPQQARPRGIVGALSASKLMPHCQSAVLLQTPASWGSRAGFSQGQGPATQQLHDHGLTIGFTCTMERLRANQWNSAAPLHEGERVQRCCDALMDSGVHRPPPNKCFPTSK